MAENKKHAWEVAPGIWLGDTTCAADCTWLSENKIGLVVCCDIECKSCPAHKECPRVERVPVHDVDDDELGNIGDFLGTACDRIAEARKRGEPALAHCFAGESRSASVLAAFIVRDTRQPLEQALALLRLNKGGRIKPNHGFMRELISWERQHLGSASLSPDDYPRARVITLGA